MWVSHEYKLNDPDKPVNVQHQLLLIVLGKCISNEKKEAKNLKSKETYFHREQPEFIILQKLLFGSILI